MPTDFALPIVDLHSHVISPDLVRFPQSPMGGGAASGWSQDRPVDDAGMLAAMRTAGVARSVLVQASTCYWHDNRYVAHAVAAHPDSFVGVYSVDVSAPDAVDRIRHWSAAGLAGLRVFIAGHTAADKSQRLDDPRADPVWRHAAELGIPVCVQIRADGLPQLEAVLQRHPQLTVLLDHFARPALEDGPPYAQAASLFALARFPHLHFKLTTHNVRESRQGASTQASFCRAVVDAFGSRRIAWGSNYPASEGSLEGLLGEAMQATAALPAADREWIFSRTAHALYPGLATPAP